MNLKKLLKEMRGKEDPSLVINPHKKEAQLTNQLEFIIDLN